MIGNVIHLVSCGRRKSSTSCLAQDMYNSERFTMLRELVDFTKSEWFIISAKYGIISPTRNIEPYDLNLSFLSEEQKSNWVKKVREELTRINPSKDKWFVLWADEAYSRLIKPLLDDLCFKTLYPFSGYTSEAQVDILKRAVNTKYISQLYSSLEYLSIKTGGIRLLRDCDGRMRWPKRGVYFIFDYNEVSLISGFTPRIVRVGTHAISRNAKSSLWGRLKTHKGTSQGGGSHRSSVFRLHIGNALLNRDNLICSTWSHSQSAPKDIRDSEEWLEKLVSEYIGNLGILVLDIDDEPSSSSLRSYIEKNSIALLSSINYSLESVTENWLGNYSKHKLIKQSNLWNVDHVSAVFDADRYFELLTNTINHTINNFTFGGN